jgi:hypothetical protein
VEKLISKSGMGIDFEQQLCQIYSREKNTDLFAQSFQTVRLVKTGEGRNCQPGLWAGNIQFNRLIFAKAFGYLSVTGVQLKTQRFYCVLWIRRVPRDR